MGVKKKKKKQNAIVLIYIHINQSVVEKILSLNLTLEETLPVHYFFLQQNVELICSLFM